MDSVTYLFFLLRFVHHDLVGSVRVSLHKWIVSLFLLLIKGTTSMEDSLPFLCRKNKDHAVTVKGKHTQRKKTA